MDSVLAFQRFAIPRNMFAQDRALLGRADMLLSESQRPRASAAELRVVVTDRWNRMVAGHGMIERSVGKSGERCRAYAGDDFAELGAAIVRPEFRGQWLWSAILDTSLNWCDFNDRVPVAVSSNPIVTGALLRRGFELRHEFTDEDIELGLYVRPKGA